MPSWSARSYSASRSSQSARARRRARLTYQAADRTLATPERNAPSAASLSGDIHGSATRMKWIVASLELRLRRITAPPLLWSDVEVFPSRLVKLEALPDSQIPTWSGTPSRPQSKVTTSPGIGESVRLKPPWFAFAAFSMYGTYEYAEPRANDGEPPASMTNQYVTAIAHHGW